MKIPSELMANIQYALVESRYQQGDFFVPTMKESDIQLILDTFVDWCSNRKLINSDGLLNMDVFLRKDR